MTADRAYEVALEGAEEPLQVRVRREGDLAYVRLGDGPERPARLLPVRGPLHALHLDGRVIEVMLAPPAEEDGAVRVALRGVAFEAAVVDERRARLARLAGGGAGGHARRELKAPMPGLVVKVLAQAGDHAAKAQPLVVLQAMKMENELSLPHEGTVKSVHVEAGQTVEQGQVLVVLE